MLRNHWMSTSAVLAISALVAGVAIGAPPPADTRIGNQAAASYTSNGDTFTVQSNLVETVVNEVFEHTLTASQTRDGAPGGLVFFPHTVTNLGNTDDVFDLGVIEAGGTDNFALTALQIFADANQDGIPDSLTPITATPSVQAGDSYGIVVRATVPASASPAQLSDFIVQSQSRGDAGDVEQNTDVVQITNDGIIDLTKDQVLANDADGNGVISVGDTIEVRLTYSNVGIGAATNVILADTLPTVNAAGAAIDLDYVALSGVWSDNPATPLTDVGGNVEFTNAQGTSLEYETGGDTTVTATLDSVQAGRTGTVSFRYMIVAAPQGVIENTATVETGTQSPTDSNTSQISVDPAANIVLADALALAPTPPSGTDGANLDGTDASTTDDDGAQDDVTTEADDAYAGETLVFDLVLTNLGNATDTFGLDFSGSSFPAGTSFDFLAADGVTPIVGDQVTLASGVATHVKVMVTLPSGAAPTAGSAGYGATISATSVNDPSTSNTTALLFDGLVLAPPVDLENLDDIGAPSGGAGTGAVYADGVSAPWNTQSVTPGQTAVFPLRITVAAGAPTNSFDLLASTDPTFATPALPDGWTVEFYRNGAKITSTGPLSPSGAVASVFDYEARVTVPESAAANLSGVGLYFRADSPVNGALDTKLDAVIVSEVVDVEIEANQVVQAAPGGTALIPHIITNLGNSTVTAGALNLGGNDPFTGQGMSATLYYDANDDGVLDASDPQISDLATIVGPDAVTGLSPGEQARVFIRVQVPSSATFGIQETGDLTVATALTTDLGAKTDANPANNRVDDTVVIISGDVVITKEQAIDADCDGAPETAFGQGSLDADPGMCIAYRLTADNTGTTEATNVVINDTVPGYTTLETCPADACAPALTIDGAASTAPLAPTDEGTGSVASSAQNAGFSLAPGSRAVLTFSVQVDE